MFCFLFFLVWFCNIMVCRPTYAVCSACSLVVEHLGKHSRTSAYKSLIWYIFYCLILNSRWKITNRIHIICMSFELCKPLGLSALFSFEAHVYSKPPFVFCMCNAMTHYNWNQSLYAISRILALINTSKFQNRSNWHLCN